MWIGVTKRFQELESNLAFYEAEVSDIKVKQLGVRQSLQRAYWGPTSDSPPGFAVGSWGKGTAIRPPSDIDLFFPLPIGEFSRFDSYVGNGQSALLQEVKGKLALSYSQTQMRGDGQVVVVNFNSVIVEIVPVFKASDTEWLMPDTHDGGSWRKVNPSLEKWFIDNSEKSRGNNVIRLIKIMKAWRDYCNVPLKSFILELAIVDFLESYYWRDQSYFFYDWFVRDFFEWLISKKNTSFFSYSSSEFINIGDSWLSRAQSASERAIKACEYERSDYVALAGEEWQKIFGGRVPVSV